MTKLLPNEIACKIPGVQIVMTLPVFRTSKIEETIDIPAKTSYGLTGDKTFQEGKTYYTEEGYRDSDLTYKEAEVVVGDPVPANTYYEETSTEAISGAQCSTIYESYTDGVWVDTIKLPDGGHRLKSREHAIEIIRTQIFTYEQNGKTYTDSTKYHALGLWSNRETLKYIPIHLRLDSDVYGESPRLFR
jgi:hypothetical protein